MGELKTRPTDQKPEDFLNAIADEQTRADCFTILKIMKQVAKAEPVMWGSSIVGFGSYHYKYASGQEGDWPILAFSPRKQNLSLYLLPCVGQHPELLKKLGKHSTGKSCLYIKRLADVDLPTLKKLIEQSFKEMTKMTKKKR